ncbi:MAG: hypothetical protein AAGA30_19425, partial [Planctomycetota bacterium]
ECKISVCYEGMNLMCSRCLLQNRVVLFSELFKFCRITVLFAACLFCIFGNEYCHSQIAISGDVTPSNVSVPVWDLGNRFLTVGEKCNGTMNINFGGVVESGIAYIGSCETSIGTVTIDGPKSEWSVDGRCVIGGRGKATLTIKSGGLLKSVNSDDGVKRKTFVGSDTGSSGTVNILGVGSHWSNTGMVIGRFGEGTVSVEGGGCLSISNYGSDLDFVPGSLTIGLVFDGSGNGGTGSGVLTVQNENSCVNVEGALNLNANAELNIESGGTVCSKFSSVGDLLSGDAKITGPGSKWVQSGRLIVGNGNMAVGVMEICDGGVVETSQNAELAVTPAQSGFAASQGTVTVSGQSSEWNLEANLFVGGAKARSGGTGLLTINEDGLVAVGRTVKVWRNGCVDLQGGILRADTLDVSEPGAKLKLSGGALEVTNFVGRLIQQDGLIEFQTLNGDLKQEGGKFAPGKSGGSASVTGNYELGRGDIEIELGGTEQGVNYDFVDVTGTAFIGDTDTTLDIRFKENFHESILESDTFTILSAGSGLTGGFAGFENGSTIRTSDGLGTFRVNYLENSIVLSDFTAIP